MVAVRDVVLDEVVLDPNAGARGSDDPPRTYLDAILRAGGQDVGRPAAADAPAREPLSPREREILRLVGDGLSNRVLAGRLFVSENTVKFHLKTIYGKLGVSSRSAATAWAYQHNLI